MSNMKEKVVLITGASSGIGRATAEAFAAKGAHVVVAARRKKELDTLVTSIEAMGGKASAIKTDVSSGKSVAQMVAHTIEVFGRLDYAVNSAGVEGKFIGITIFCMVVVCACGYRFAGQGGFPKGVERIFIEVFENRTSKTGIEY